MRKPIETTPSGRRITDEEGKVFFDVQDELWREYHYSHGIVERIEKPVAVHSSKSGGHIVVDAKDKGHYLPKGWTRITWEVQPNSPIVFFTSADATK